MTDPSPLTPVDSPELASPRGHYAHAVVHGHTAYLSGQLPVDASGVVHAEDAFLDQVRLVLGNIDDVLEAVGTDRTHLLSVTVYVADIAQWGEFDAVYSAWLGSHRPSRTVVPVPELHHHAALEISAIAAVR